MSDIREGRMLGTITKKVRLIVPGKGEHIGTVLGAPIGENRSRFVFAHRQSPRHTPRDYLVLELDKLQTVKEKGGQIDIRALAPLQSGTYGNRNAAWIPTLERLFQRYGV
jgi:hypothetical protein